jgi:hypothetical protein
MVFFIRKITMRLLALSVVLATSVMAGCSFVSLTEKGEKVILLSQEQAHHCERIGATVVSVKDSVIGVDRSIEKMDAELALLARNSAPDIGGDAVLREERLADGKQRFGVYRCRR